MTEPKEASVRFIERDGGFGIYIKTKKGEWLSIQHGVGSYCSPEANQSTHKPVNWTFEIATIDKKGNIPARKWTSSGGDAVRGWTTIEELNEVIEHIV